MTEACTHPLLESKLRPRQTIFESVGAHAIDNVRPLTTSGQHPGTTCFSVTGRVRAGQLSQSVRQAVSQSVCVSVWLSDVGLCARRSVCLSVFRTVCLCLSVCLSVCMYVCMHTCEQDRMLAHVYVCMYVRKYVCMYVCVL